jgi:NADH-quinone oxidoreductase subunit F
VIAENKVLSARFGKPQSWTLASYRKDGGYETWLATLKAKRPPAEITAEVKASGLKGRGGAGFSTGMKWSFVPKGTDKPVYLCVNGDESEPGTFKDRQILEFDPHMLLEGVGLTCYAIGAHTAYVYLRCEFAEGIRRVQAAIDEAYAAKLFGKDVAGSGFDVECTCTSAPAPTSAARRPRCSTASRACGPTRATSRPSRRSRACSAARRSSTTSRPARTSP